MNGLSIVFRNKEEYRRACEFIGEEDCFISWAPQMAERETAIVVWAEKHTFMSTGTVGCAEHQRSEGIRTVEFSECFKL